MKSRLAILLVPVFVSIQLMAAPQQFGGSVDKTLLTSISEIKTNPAQFLGKTITVQGEVVSVCQKKGCWMQLAVAGGQQLKIKVRDGDMVFPLSSRGKQALAMGQLLKIELDLASSREQLAAQAKLPGKNVDVTTVTEPLVSWQLVPTAVEILTE